MKPVSLLLPLTLANGTTSAWEFEIPSTPSPNYFYGIGKNKGCTQKNIPENTWWRWTRDPSENCCLRLWANKDCSSDYLGWTCSNLEHRTTNYMRAFKVTNC